MEEVNFRDFGPTSSGWKRGLEDDDYEYRIINSPAIDIYCESKRKQNMKCRKIVKEAGKYPMWWIRFCDSRNKLGQAAEDMQQAYFESGNNKWNEYYHKMSSLWGQLSGVQYKESTKRCSKMKFKKIVKEADEQNYSDAPAVYVGTYGKYADGSIDGEWVKLTDFDTYDDFMDYIRELHKDESDPEFMFQDYENFPEAWYSESGLSEETFDKIIEWYEMDDEERSAYEAYLDLGVGDDIEDFHERYEGQFSSPTDLAYHLVEELGLPGNAEYYFDFETFGRELSYDYHEGDPDYEDDEGNPQDPEHYYDSDEHDIGEIRSDSELGEDFVDNMGGVEELGKDTIERYFDYEQFGRGSKVQSEL